MVKALLDGRKTQTRRLQGFDAINDDPSRYSFLGIVSGPGVPHFAFRDLQTGHQVLIKCRVVKGDRLWVREAWRSQEEFDDLSPTEIGEQFAAEHGEPWCPVFFEADQQCDGSSVEMWQQSPPGRLRASMHMPRWASRLTLTVADVRVQRLQQTSKEDAADEGLFKLPATGRYVIFKGDQYFGAAEFDPRLTYRRLWEEINGTGSWAANPWVVAITFEVVKANIDATSTRAAA